MDAPRVVVLLVGPKGSGKTFVGALVSERLGLAFLRVEPIFLAHQAASRLAGAARDAEGYARVLAEVERRLAGAPGLLLESTGASEVFPAFLEALRARHPVRLVAVRASPAVCLERVRTRDAADHIPVSDERAAEINRRAAAVRLPWDLELDNGGPAPAEVIVEAFRRLLAPRS